MRLLQEKDDTVTEYKHDPIQSGLCPLIQITYVNNIALAVLRHLSNLYYIWQRKRPEQFVDMLVVFEQNKSTEYITLNNAVQICGSLLRLELLLYTDYTGCHLNRTYEVHMYIMSHFAHWQYYGTCPICITYGKDRNLTSSQTCWQCQNKSIEYITLNMVVQKICGSLHGLELLLYTHYRGCHLNRTYEVYILSHLQKCTCSSRFKIQQVLLLFYNGIYTV